MTQRDLSRLSGMAQPAIARIERDGVSPRLATLDRLVRTTGHELTLAPAIGAGVDRSLIRAALRRTPEERVGAAGQAGRRLAAFRAEAARDRSS